MKVMLERLNNHVPLLGIFKMRGKCNIIRLTKLCSACNHRMFLSGLESGRLDCSTSIPT